MVQPSAMTCKCLLILYVDGLVRDKIGRRRMGKGNFINSSQPMRIGYRGNVGMLKGRIFHVFPRVANTPSRRTYSII